MQDALGAQGPVVMPSGAQPTGDKQKTGKMVFDLEINKRTDEKQTQRCFIGRQNLSQTHQEVLNLWETDKQETHIQKILTS